MPEEQPTTEISPDIQVDGAKLLSELPKETVSPGIPLTLESLFKLLNSHQHQGSDGTETLKAGRIKVGTAIRDSTGTQTITHGLNATPKLVLIFAVGLSGTVQGVMSTGYGVGTASGDYNVVFSDFGSSSFTSDRIVEVRIASGNSLAATLTRLTPTELDLAWTLSGPSFTARYLWAVFS